MELPPADKTDSAEKESAAALTQPGATVKQVASGLTGPALALLKRVDPKAYSRLFEQIQTIEISSTKSSRSQVANYLRLVIPQLEQALAAGHSETEDTGEDRAEQDASADTDQPRR